MISKCRYKLQQLQCTKKTIAGWCPMKTNELLKRWERRHTQAGNGKLEVKCICGHGTIAANYSQTMNSLGKFWEKQDKLVFLFGM